MIDQLIDQFNKSTGNAERQQSLLAFAARLTQLDEAETRLLFERLIVVARNTDDGVWPEWLAVLFGHTAARGGSDWPGSESLSSMLEMYRLCPADRQLRNLLLALIARSENPSSSEIWTELLCSDPPQTMGAIGLAFSPMLASDRSYPAAMLTRLIHEATANLYVAAAVYDLANHAFRTGAVSTHPAGDRVSELCGLLGALVGQMSRIENGELPPDASPESLAQTVSNAVSLIIAVIDTLGLIEDERAIGKLNQATGMKHRRIQVEAAAALARMNDENGKRRLIDCAQHPVVRQRVISYATELGFEHEISLEYKGPIATAESHLALWLAEPGQMGLAPTQMKLIDQRELVWPGYEQQVVCFLFEFRFGTSEQAYGNVGISGPVTRAFLADLTRLSTADQYAAFAGWQTVSEQIFLVPIERAESLLAGETSHLKRSLARHELENRAAVAIAGFFGKHVLVATGERDGQSGTLIVDGDDGDDGDDWIPAGNPRSPIDWALALDIWRGRKLLAHFNPELDFAGS